MKTAQTLKNIVLLIADKAEGIILIAGGILTVGKASVNKIPAEFCNFHVLFCISKCALELL